MTRRCDPTVASSLSTLLPCYSNAKPVSATIDPTIWRWPRALTPTSGKVHIRLCSTCRYRHLYYRLPGGKFTATYAFSAIIAIIYSLKQRARSDSRCDMVSCLQSLPYIPLVLATADVPLFLATMVFSDQLVGVKPKRDHTQHADVSEANFHLIWIWIWENFYKNVISNRSKCEI